MQTPLLARGQADAEYRATLYLLAAAILEQSTMLPQPDPRSPDVRALVTAAMAELIPPPTSAAADQLAAAGPFVLDLLPGPDGLTDPEGKLELRRLVVTRLHTRGGPRRPRGRPAAQPPLGFPPFHPAS